MSKLIKTPDSAKEGLNGPAGEEQERRQVLKKLGRFATVTAPAVAVKSGRRWQAESRDRSFQRTDWPDRSHRRRVRTKFADLLTST